MNGVKNDSPKEKQYTVKTPVPPVEAGTSGGHTHS